MVEIAVDAVGCKNQMLADAVHLRAQVEHGHGLLVAAGAVAIEALAVGVVAQAHQPERGDGTVEQRIRARRRLDAEPELICEVLGHAQYGHQQRRRPVLER